MNMNKREEKKNRNTEGIKKKEKEMGVKIEQALEYLFNVLK